MRRGDVKAPAAARAIGDLMSEVLKAAAPKRRELEALVEAWGRAAGADTARRSRPLAFKAGELTVGFESAAMRQEVECFRKKEILRALGKAYPDARILKLRCVLRG
jgi:hypothetical protein